MKYLMHSIFILALLTGLCSPVLADNNWQGLQIEASAGFRNSKTNNDDLYGTSSGGVTTLQNTVTDSTRSDTAYTLGAGYGLSMGENSLLTLGIDYSPQAWNSGTFKVGTSSAHYTYKNQINYYVAPGWIMDSNTLIYTKIGYSTVNAKGLGTNPFDGIGNPNKTLNGYSLGGGVKYMFNPKVYALGDISYMNFQKTKISGYDATTNLTDSIKTSLTGYTLSFGLGMKF